MYSGLENPDICSWLVKERLETVAMSHRCDFVSMQRKWKLVRLGCIGIEPHIYNAL